MKCNFYIIYNKISFKKLFVSVLFLIFSFSISAQYYIRGQIKDEKNLAVQNAKIYLHSSHQLFFSGSSGGFGIPTSLLYDSLTFNADGFEPKSISIKSDVYQEIVLKMVLTNTNLQKQKLVSVTEDMNRRAVNEAVYGNESYSNLVENNFVKANKYPATAFSVRVDKASYSNIRRFINQKSFVPPDAVRIEEMVNYFNLNYKAPEKNDVFKIESQLTSCPWNVAHQLLFINLNAKKINIDNVPPGNFVFLIDVSGSMDLPNRLPLLKASFQLLVNNLRAVDTISIVTYGGSVGIKLLPTSGKEKQKIIQAIEELNAEGETPGEAGIKAAYQLAKKSFIKNGNNRIILATDGDFNVGQSTEKELEDLISKQRQSGIYLTCLGVGMGNYKDSKIEALAKRGNGNFAYLDDIKEGEKVLVKELTQTLYTIANDVYLNVQFNPAMVKEYRLIGYDNKKGIVADSLSKLEGGEVGSGNSITSVFEIVPTEENLFPDDVFFQDDIASVQLNYRLPSDTSQVSTTYACENNYAEFNEINDDLQFASSLVMFGLMLRKSKYISNISWSDVEQIAKQSKNKNDYLQNEFITLIEKVKKIYSKKNTRKNDD